MNRQQFGLGAGSAIVLMGTVGILGLVALTFLGANVSTKFSTIATSITSGDASGADGWGGSYREAEEKPADPFGMPKPPASAAAPGGLQIIRGGQKDQDAPAKAKQEPPEEGERQGQSDSGNERVRSWFPEAFLWQPLIETDGSGAASLDVRVPDQLTTWRVLALGHTRAGRQSGTTATFVSSMPVYVDPVVPGWLYSGDRVSLPIQVVNTTGDAVRASLSVSSDGPLSGAASGDIALPAYGSTVRDVDLVAKGAGGGSVAARLAGTDAAIRTIPVLPTGRPVEARHGGTVADRRMFSVGGPADADPATQTTTVLVFPGPLAVLESEIERAGGGYTVADSAYGFALASRVERLSGTLGVEIDRKALRKEQILAWQRLSPYAVSPSWGDSADLLVAVRDVKGHQQAEELPPRLVRLLVEGQRGDGTWSRNHSTSLQAVLVDTGIAAGAIPAGFSDPGDNAIRKASGALERHVKDVEDPYTAAVVLASGVVDDDTAAVLRKQVVDALVDTDHGKSVAVPDQTMNAWGSAPTHQEMLAFTILALGDADDTAAIRRDLAGELMASYDASNGFGAGSADIYALDAVIATLPPLSSTVHVKLMRGSAVVAEGTLDPKQPKVPAALVTRGIGDFEVVCDPPVPGLAFVATGRSYVPWTGRESLSGVDVQVEAGRMRVGEDSVITIHIAAPGATSVTIEQGLAPGAVVDTDVLGNLADRTVSREVRTDRVRLVTREFLPGEEIVLPITVRPAFAGEFSTVPLTVEVPGYGRVDVQPLVWTVEG